MTSLARHSVSVRAVDSAPTHAGVSSRREAATDVRSADYVSVIHVPTVQATESVPVAVGFPCVPALGARSTRERGVHEEHGNTAFFSLLLDARLQEAEGPGMSVCSLVLTDPDSVPDALQVFQFDAATLRKSPRYDAFGDDAALVQDVPLLAAVESSRDSACAASAFLLESLSRSSLLSAVLAQGTAVEENGSHIWCNHGCGVPEAAVHADPRGRFIIGGIRQLDGDFEVVVRAASHECTSARFAGAKPVSVHGPHLHTEPHAAIDARKTQHEFLVLEAPFPTVQQHEPGRREPGVRVVSECGEGLVRCLHAARGTDGDLTHEIVLAPDFLVISGLELAGVRAALAGFDVSGERIASCCEVTHGLVKQVRRTNEFERDRALHGSLLREENDLHFSTEPSAGDADASAVAVDAGFTVDGFIASQYELQ